MKFWLDLAVQNAEALAAVIGLLVALWALTLQRREIAKNGKISALIHASKMLQEEIDFRRQIMESIANVPDKKAAWYGHQKRVNGELRPLKKKIDMEFLNLASRYDGILHEREVRRALVPKVQEDSEVA